MGVIFLLFYRLYHITLWIFVLALVHFLSEAFIYKTAPLTIGVMAPLIVASRYCSSIIPSDQIVSLFW